MSSPSYHITEPHPSVPKSHYFHSGRGGAGNVTYVDPASVTSPTSASGPASATTLTAANSTAYVTVGRGGAGNMRHNNERAIFSFDEELERQRKLLEHAAPVYLVGRGGAGNAHYTEGSESLRSERSESKSSDAGAARRSIEGAWNRVRGSFNSVKN